MRPLIEGRDVKWRDYAFCQRANQSRMLRAGQWKYVYGAGGRILALYDLKSDPDEDRNLAGEKAHAEALRRMHRRLLAVMTADGDPLAAKLPSDPVA
jgi:arylsulfatase A-like enzyme